MSKFNKTTRGNGVDSQATVNHAGGKAFNLSAEMELYSAVCTTLLADLSYEKADERLSRISNLLNKVSPEFVAKLAVYAREKMNLRTVPLVLAVELAKIHKGDNLVSRMTSRVIQRADELSDILAVYQALNRRTGLKKLNKMSNQIKKGIAEAFNKFDEYQFAKYNQSNEVKLRDALFLTHPTPKDIEQAAIFDRLAKDTLATPETWEVKISAAGSDVEAKRAAWEELIDNRSLGYMALLRNLRNILQANVSKEHMLKVCEYLSNENAVKNSKQFPFRFLSAYLMLINDKTVENNQSFKMVTKALETAVTYTGGSYSGIKETDSVLIASDVSGSMMQHKIGGPRSLLTAYEIGLLMSMILQHHCNFVTSGFFGNDWKVVNLPSENILKNTNDLKKREGEVGYSTNGFKVLKWMNNSNTMYDKVMIFTDCQLWNTNGHWNTNRYGQRSEDMTVLWNEYRKKNPNAKLYLFDLSGYGTTPVKINKDNVYVISGFSDKVFDMLDSIENGSSVIEEINKIEI